MTRSSDRSFQLVQWLCWIVCVGLLAAVPWRPAAADLYTVPGVIVAVAADSSVKAKAMAQDTAKEQAFRRLAERLVVPEDLAAIPSVGLDRIEPTIRSVRVLDEVVTGTTFDGRFTIQFDPAATRRLLDELGLRYTEAQSRPYVIVPVYGAPPDAALWQDPNPWRAAWESFGGVEDTLVPLKVPLGDLQDVVAVDANQALEGYARGLGDLAANYDSAGSVVAAAEVTGNPWNGGASLKIAVRSYGEILGEPFSAQITQTPDEEAQAFFQRGVIAVLQGLETAWKSANAIQYSAAESLRARALASALQDWLLIRKTLEQEPLVSEVKVVSLRRGEVILDLVHRGTADQLQRALAQRGVNLVQTAEGWDLQLGGTVGGIEARPLPAPTSGGSSSE